MIPSRAGIDDSDLDTFAEVSPGMKLVHTSGVMRGVVGSCNVIRDEVGYGDSQRNVVVPPNALDTRQLRESVDVVRLGLHACACEDVAVEGLDDLDVVVIAGC